MDRNLEIKDILGTTKKKKKEKKEKKEKKNINGWELGSYNIQLTENGNLSPLFRNVSNNEIFYESHQDVVVELPEGAIELAYTKKGNQSFSYNENIFGVQFHPEFTFEVARALMDLRISKGIAIDNDKLDLCTKGKNILNNYINFLNERSMI